MKESNGLSSGRWPGKNNSRLLNSQEKTMSSNQTTIETLSFEQAYRELEETVQKLEAGNLSLEEALILYERGMALAQYCNQQLDKAELRIKTLTPSGALIDFDET
jgi:exodeoxyribonuclease VII small subunit